MRYWTFLSFLISFSVVITITSSCSSPNPTMVGSNPDLIETNGFLPVYIVDRFADSSISAGYGTLGLFNVSIDVDNLEGEITSLRKASLEDVLEVVDITNFMQLVPCTNCVKLSGISLDLYDNLVLTIGIKHPFDVGDPFKPVTGRNRGDLHIFNVEGIVISDGFNLLAFTDLARTVADSKLLNADGYSGYLDSAIDNFFQTNANIHPYILHFRDYSQGNFDRDNPMGFESITSPPPTGNLVMAMGSDYDYQDYIFGISDGSFSFTYAVGCTYPVASASKTQRFTPEYRVPQHLKKAASEIGVQVTRNELRAGVMTSDADIRIFVVDLSHDISVGTNLDQMLAESNVASVMIDIPGVLLSIVEETTPTGGSGHDPSDPLIFDITIQNEANATSGLYHGLVKVLDSYTPGLNTSPLLDGKDAIERVSPLDNPLTGLFELDEFATYQLFTISVGETSSVDPEVHAVTGCPQVIVGLPFSFKVTVDYPHPGQQLYYYWDDGETNPGEYDNGMTLDGEIELSYSTVGTYFVDVRVEDGMGGVGYSASHFEVEVLPAGVFVDADYTGSIQDGSLDYPYTLIQDGIDNATSSGYIFILPAQNHYIPFVIESDMVVMGIDLDCGLQRPEVNQIGTWQYANGIQNFTIAGFVFNLDVPYSGTHELFVIRNADNMTIHNCRFTGDTLGSITQYMRLAGVNNSRITYCEWTKIRLNGSPTADRRVHMINGTNCNNFLLMHNEVHDIGIPDLGSESGWTWMTGFRFGISTSPHNDSIIIKNNLIYNIWDHSPDTPTTFNRIFALQINNTDNYQLLHNTIDNLDSNNGNHLLRSTTVGFYDGLSSGIMKNNIFKSLNYYNGSIMLMSWNAGFWGDIGTDIVTAEYSCVYWGEPTPPGYPCQTASYLNLMHKGTGSYDQNDLIDPDFDYTPGQTYYHPQNSTVLTGAEDGSQMGCFGGPYGNWIPPSQYYNQ